MQVDLPQFGAIQCIPSSRIVRAIRECATKTVNNVVLGGSKPVRRAETALQHSLRSAGIGRRGPGMQLSPEMSTTLDDSPPHEH